MKKPFLSLQIRSFIRRLVRHNLQQAIDEAIAEQNRRAARPLSRQEILGIAKGQEQEA